MMSLILCRHEHIVKQKGREVLMKTN